MEPRVLAHQALEVWLYAPLLRVGAGLLVHDVNYNGALDALQTPVQGDFLRDYGGGQRSALDFSFGMDTLELLGFERMC